MPDNVAFLSKSFEPFQLSQQFTIENKSISSVNVDNIRIVNNQIVADFSNNYASKTFVNKKFTESNTVSISSSTRILNAFDNADEFLKRFDIFSDKYTHIEFTLKVNKLPMDAPQALKDFFDKKLSAEALKRLMKEIEQKITDYKANAKVEGELKESLIKSVMLYFDDIKNRSFSNKIVGSIALSMFFSYVIAYASSHLIIAGAVLGLIAIPFVALTLCSEVYKQKADALHLFSALSNQNIDTPTNKNKLVDKLTVLLNKSRMDVASYKQTCHEAIEIGQSIEESREYSLCYRSMLLAKSFFTPNAYDVGYYIGQEMQRNKALKNKI